MLLRRAILLLSVVDTRLLSMNGHYSWSIASVEGLRWQQQAGMVSIVWTEVLWCGDRVLLFVSTYCASAVVSLKTAGIASDPRTHVPSGGLPVLRSRF